MLLFKERMCISNGKYSTYGVSAYHSDRYLTHQILGYCGRPESACARMHYQYAYPPPGRYASLRPCMIVRHRLALADRNLSYIPSSFLPIFDTLPLHCSDISYSTIVCLGMAEFDNFGHARSQTHGGLLDIPELILLQQVSH
jgi:hypothetical protein